MLLCICWILSWDSRMLSFNTGKRKGKCSLPDCSHLVLSAIDTCREIGQELDFWDSNVSDIDIQLPISKIHSWALKNVANLADCFQQFVLARLCYLTTPEVGHLIPFIFAFLGASDFSDIRTNIICVTLIWCCEVVAGWSFLFGPLWVCLPSEYGASSAWQWKVMALRRYMIWQMIYFKLANHAWTLVFFAPFGF